MSKFFALILVPLLLVACAPAPEPVADAKDAGMDHAKMNPVTGATPASPATAAMAKAHATMQEGMKQEFTGDPDRDFLLGMVPHHQGAVEMAKVEMQYGRDPQVKELAQKVIDDQEKEITQMRHMLRDQGPMPR